MTKKKKVIKKKNRFTTATHLVENETQIPQALLDRAKKVGISDAQVKSLATEENLKRHCDRISPQTNPDSMPVIGHIKPTVRVEPEALPKSLDVSKDTLRDEKGILESLVRKLNIKHNTPKLSTITKTIVYDCEKKQIVVAKYEIEQ